MDHRYPLKCQANHLSKGMHDYPILVCPQPPIWLTVGAIIACDSGFWGVSCTHCPSTFSTTFIIIHHHRIPVTPTVQSDSLGWYLIVLAIKRIVSSMPRNLHCWGLDKLRLWRPPPFMVVYVRFSNHDSVMEINCLCLFNSPVPLMKELANIQPRGLKPLIERLQVEQLIPQITSNTVSRCHIRSFQLSRNSWSGVALEFLWSLSDTLFRNLKCALPVCLSLK